MHHLREALIATSPIAAGLVYFALAYALVEWLVVRRRLLSGYQLKLVDFVWVCAATIELAFLLLSDRENVLKERISMDESRSAAIRASFLDKRKVGTDECMAGQWPKGAVPGKSYRENGNMVTDACKGVSFTLNLAGRFFDDEQLWRYPASLETATRFANANESVFGDGFQRTFANAWNPPREVDQLTLRAKDELAHDAQSVVTLKHDAGRIAVEQEVVHSLGAIGLYWPVVVATSLAFSIGKSRLELRKERHARRPKGGGESGAPPA